MVCHYQVFQDSIEMKYLMYLVGRKRNELSYLYRKVVSVTFNQVSQLVKQIPTFRCIHATPW